MYKIDGTTITLTRGDSFYVQVVMKNEDKTDYTPQPGDSVRFALKKRYQDAEPLILKQIPTDTLILHLIPEDTKELPFGKYVYDIELTKANGDVDTFIYESIFEIAKEVH